jgi:hypothetical protein
MLNGVAPSTVKTLEQPKKTHANPTRFKEVITWYIPTRRSLVDRINSTRR